MHIRCPISGVVSVLFDKVTATITAPHPMLSISTTELLSEIYPAYKNGLLTPDTIHVFGISLIQKLPIEGTISLVTSNTEQYQPFWESQIPKLIPLCRRLDGRGFKNLPTIRVTIESLPHLPYWIDELHDALTYASLPISEEARRLNREAYKSSFLNEKLNLGEVPVTSWSEEEKDSLILRAIRGSVLTTKEQLAFPQLIADWADKETKFPLTSIRLKDGKKTTQKSIWQNIITKSIRAGSSYLDLISGEFTLDDIQDLEAHLLCGLRGSSIQSKFLFEKLKEATEILEEFTGAGKGNATQLNATITSSELPKTENFHHREPSELYQMNPETGEKVRNLSLKEKLAIKLANARMKK